MTAAQDGEQNQLTDNGNDDRAKTAEAVRKRKRTSTDIVRRCAIVYIIERWMASRLTFSTARRGASFDPVV